MSHFHQSLVEKVYIACLDVVPAASDVTYSLYFDVFIKCV